MNKITPRRIAIFSSEVMMKKESIALVCFTAEGQLVVQCLTHRVALAAERTLGEQCDAQPESRSLVRLLRSRPVPSAAALPFAECAPRGRRFCSDSTRSIAERFR